MIYKSSNAFSLWDFNVSLQLLLIRCSGLEDTKFNNIDVVFMGCTYLNIPTEMKGIEIMESQNLNLSEYLEDNLTKKLFLLKSNGKNYYISAMSCFVYRNSLEFYESSIRDSGSHSVLIASSEM